MQQFQMAAVFSLVSISMLALEGFSEPLRSDNCRISETMVSLRYGNVHEVPICFPIIKYPTGEKTEDTGGKPIRYDRFTCHKDRCNLCRCDVSRGYKLSNDSRNAECVMLCPVTKHTLKRCFNIGTARICYH
uniref:Secreted protein n=1 Tax=Ascaris lumbricoides TaxID=6252 RepID=A0A0M3IF54_ASCLU